MNSFLANNGAEQSKSVCEFDNVKEVRVILRLLQIHFFANHRAEQKFVSNVQEVSVSLLTCAVVKPFRATE